jgi:hypothetical protein
MSDKKDTIYDSSEDLDEKVLIATEEQFDKIEAYLNSNESNELLERALQKAKNNPSW